MSVKPQNRQHPRVEVREVIVGFPDGDRIVQGNVSSGGVGFWLDLVHPPTEGTRLLVRLVDSDESLMVPAEVRHVAFEVERSAFYVWASFVDTDDLVEGPLYRFVEERLLLERTGG